MKPPLKGDIWTDFGESCIGSAKGGAGRHDEPKLEFVAYFWGSVGGKLAADSHLSMSGTLILT